MTVQPVSVRSAAVVTKEPGWLYRFDQIEQAIDSVGGDWEAVRALLGGKGANLGEMTRLDIPVPPGFTVTTAACNAYLDRGGVLPEGLWEEILQALHHIETATGQGFGEPERPLLLSSRSGAKFSMPGMMDTVLNIGLNDRVVEEMATRGDARFAYDLYRRLIQMFGHVVLEVPDEAFEEILTAARRRAAVDDDSALQVGDWIRVIAGFRALILEQTGAPFPEDPLTQLRLAVEAVFRSWNGRRARDYRRATGIAHTLGTAVNIQTMVFGNRGSRSGTGVLFSRNPATGTNEFYGDYLLNAQGEDVVAGIRAVQPIATLQSEMPAIYDALTGIARRLERHFRDVQDIEFTIEEGKLWILQTRDGKRGARAAVRFAVDLVEEGVISRDEALMRITPAQIEGFLHPQFDPEVTVAARRDGRLIARGVNASPGAAVGEAVFDADTAEEWGSAGRDVIMVRPETRPDDVHGMVAARGILTALGGNASHAAIVARQFGVPAVVGCHALEIDLDARSLRVGPTVVREGEILSIDGTTGELFAGALPTVRPDLDDPALTTLLEWADQRRVLGVRANADTPEDATRARALGAEGVGLCRTEHMFFDEAWLPVVQDMILAEEPERRQAALDALLPYQRDAFVGIFRAMEGQPVIIRLMDPPLHEFLPSEKNLLVEITSLLIRGGAPEHLSRLETLLRTVQRMHESNPMLGLRGVRLGIVVPGVLEMQVRAIFEAACMVVREGREVDLEIMIPLVAHANELALEQAALERVAREVLVEQGLTIPYRFGTMIELPRAALTAGELAGVAEFFSFGTNDLTQTTFGLSRDDAEAGFLMDYLEKGILAASPFKTLDVAGVGRLMRIAIEEGRAVRPEIEIGICGEHGGDPASIEFCHKVGVDYVSCSPYRVPVARLAAARAALTARR